MTKATLNRRQLLELAGGGVLATAASACGPEGQAPEQGVAPAPTPAPPLADPLHYSSVRALAAAIRDGRVTSAEVVDACLARIDAVNPVLNAVVQLRADAARQQAQQADAAVAAGNTVGPLHGVPMTIKDSLDTADLISTGGSMGRASFVPEQDATVVRRAREAGAILLGKTNTPELTLSYETDNLVYGRTSNPWDVDRTSGGSSGGAAAIVACGGAAFDIGSDYGGSIRLPAHFNGIAGIKPTHGRVSRAGHIFPYGGTHDSFQQIGPFGRYVDDLVLLLPLLAGPDNIDPALVPMPLGDPGDVDLGALRVGFHVDNGVSTPTPETQDVVRAAAAAMEALGAQVDESRPDGIEESFTLGFAVFGADGQAAVRRLLQQAGTDDASIPTEGDGLPATELDQLLADVYDLRSRMHRYLDDHDVIICPANAKPAVPHGATDLPDYSYTLSYNVTGWPGVVVRGGTSPEGLPIGVQVVAAPAREDVALAVALHLEASLGGFEPPPI